MEISSLARALITASVRNFKEVSEMRKEQVNPKMDLSKGPAGKEPIADERESAKMPQVGTMPTGKKAAKKVEIGQG